MKNFYILVEIEENGKYYSYIIKSNNNENIYYKLKNIKNIKTATICKTKKEAEYRVKHYNAVYKANNNNLFI